MKEYACTEGRFLKDAAQHVMTVLRDDGANRHIRFKRPDSGAYWFDLITWPGTLCIDGDMGTYVFKRLHDMFEFFRTDREYYERQGINRLAINPSYWSEKLQAVSVYGKGYEEFDADRFREVVKEHFDRWVEDKCPSDEAKAGLWLEIESEVLAMTDDGETRAMDAAMNFVNNEHGFEFADFWDHNLKRYTFHFIWCCYAVAWGVKTYDTAQHQNHSTKDAA